MTVHPGDVFANTAHSSPVGPRPSWYSPSLLRITPPYVASEPGPVGYTQASNVTSFVIVIAPLSGTAM